MNLQICKLHPDATVPTYGTDGAACFDLYAVGAARVAGFNAATVRTGLAIGIPDGWVLLIYSRSGMGFKHGLRLGNCVGVIDADYTGEILVRLHNDKPYGYDIEPGDRIAQALLQPAQRVDFQVVEQLALTSRGEGGFGSTGKGITA